MRISLVRFVYSSFLAFGFNPRVFHAALLGIPYYIINFVKLTLLMFRYSDHKSSLPDSSKRLGFFYPVLCEFNSQAESASGHYYHQDLYVANCIYRSNPEIHFDVGSKVDSFIAHLLSFDQRVVVGDIRPIEIPSPLVSFYRFHLMNSSYNLTDSFDSISCLHALEHMGLGRYGDPVDPFGHHKAIRNLVSRLSPDGTLYLSHPCGRIGRIEYNAHRVISLIEMKHLFDSLSLQVNSFSYVDDAGSLVCDVPLSSIDYDKCYDLHYGCAIWTLKFQT